LTRSPYLYTYAPPVRSNSADRPAAPDTEVAALVLKILVEYQVADIAGDRIKIG